MRTFKTRLITLVVICAVGLFPAASSFAQQYVDFPKTSFAVSSADEELHALSLTRFHFLTLKEFQSVLFSPEGNQLLPSFEAQVLNTGLDQFLISASRETTLLEALRQNKAVRLQFAIPHAEPGEYRIVDHPFKKQLYQFEPLIESIPVAIDIQPILDEPIAFHITLTNGSEVHSYKVDWAGKIS